jgi:hypothetical protein
MCVADRRLTQFILGLHYERSDWSVHFNAAYTTDTVDTSEATETDGYEVFGNIIIEWRV